MSGVAPRPGRWLPRLALGRQRGTPVAAAGHTVTPVAGRVEVALPWVTAAWAFPVAVEVNEADGARRSQPVWDVTRLAQGLLLIAGLALGAALARRRRRPQDGGRR
jgi:hypothetical protein